MAQDDDFTLDDLDSLTFDSVDNPHTDLDEYGVWVKSGPEDLSEASMANEDEEEDFLNSDELAGLDADLDLTGAVEMDGEDLEDEQNLESITHEAVDDGVEEVELDEFVSFDEEEISDLEVDVPTSSLTSEGSSEDEFLDIDIEIEDSIADDELEILEGSKVSRLGRVPGSEEVDLSAFDPSPATDFSSDFDDVLAEEKDAGLDLDASVVETPLDELDSFEEKAPRPKHEPKELPLAETLLRKIEAELSSIKTEISSLKEEIGKFKPGAVSGQESTPDEPTKGGFFSDDDDEVIALTGDELDSILSSADVMTKDDQKTGGDPSPEDLLTLDSEGNILDGEPSSDLDFLGGTSLEEGLDDEAEIPAFPVDSPIPGGSPLEKGVPENIELEDDTVNLLNDEIAALEGNGFQAIEEEEIDLTLPASLPESLQLIGEVAEDVSSEFLNETSTAGEAHGEALEIPFDDDLDLETGAIPETATPESDFDPNLVEEDLSAGFNDSQVDLLPTEPPAPARTSGQSGLTDSMRSEIKAVLTYMDKLLSSLPDEKIQEFAESEHFEVYKKLFEEMGLTE